VYQGLEDEVYATVCCSVLQCVAARCSVLQCVAVLFVANYLLYQGWKDGVEFTIRDTNTFAANEICGFINAENNNLV